MVAASSINYRNPVVVAKFIVTTGRAEDKAVAHHLVSIGSVDGNNSRMAITLDTSTATITRMWPCPFCGASSVEEIGCGWTSPGCRVVFCAGCGAIYEEVPDDADDPKQLDPSWPLPAWSDDPPSEPDA